VSALHRAFCENLSSDTVVLTDSESHHVQHVLRMTRGAVLGLFDGKGHEAIATIAAVSRHDVTCAVNSVRLVERLPRPQVIVAASPPKGDRLKWMVEKLTEIGADRLILLQTERSIVHPGETRLDKLESSVIAACKQCGRSWKMDLLPLVPLRKLLTERLPETAPTTWMIAHPGNSSGSLRSSVSTLPSNHHRIVLIGPEGGFTDSEVEFAKERDVLPISWPENILRIETAAVVFAAAMLSA
jgi:16S rRNA (uracil1498-N3)-methyltransferase